MHTAICDLLKVRLCSFRCLSTLKLWVYVPFANGLLSQIGAFDNAAHTHQPSGAWPETLPLPPQLVSHRGKRAEIVLTEGFGWDPALSCAGVNAEKLFTAAGLRADAAALFAEEQRLATDARLTSFAMMCRSGGGMCPPRVQDF